MLYQRRSIDLSNPPQWLIESLGASTYSGESVTVERSLTIPAVLNGFTILMEDTSSLPFILYRRLDRGKLRAVESPYYSLMHDQPNREMTSMVFREIMMGHLLGWGNFYGQLLWNSKGVVEEIYPLKPNQMEVGRLKGERVYLYRADNGNPISFRQDQILHIPAFGFDGMRGYSRISLARNAIGLAMATEKYGSKIFANDARPSVVLTHPQGLSDNARKNITESWQQHYAGAGNAAKFAVLEEGMDLKTIGFPPDDAQFIETQKWTVQQIARVFRIPPHMLGDVERTTSWGSGIEQQEIGYLTHTLRPWMVRIEQQCNKDILLTDDRREYFYEHLVDAMLRTDLQTRMQAYAVAITNGIYTRNEVRERENLLPYDGGDEPLTPLNMTTGNNDQTDDQTDPVDQPDATPQRDITPLVMDALRRISKRDHNELQGALKRYAEKDDRFLQWVEQFYKRDLPEFILATFQPFIDAGFIAAGQVRAFTISLTEQRGESISAADYASLDPSELLTIYQEASHA